MKYLGVCGFLAAFLAAASVLADPVPDINVGSHVLLPNTAHQAVALLVTGGQMVGGVNLYAQIGDGTPAYGGSTIGPALESADLITGTIFASNHTPPVDNQAGLDPPAPQNLSWWVQTNSGHVAANGLVATVYVDTTGFTSGTWDLRMSSTLAGDTSFLDGAPDYTIVPTITDGSITIAPEPSTLILLGAGLLSLLAYAWRK